MALFTVERRSSLPADEAWRRLTDWRLHAAHTPLTRIAVRPPGETRTGTTVVARTGIGRAAFDDPMDVVRWQPPTEHRPGVCRLEKRGRVVAGWAEIEVRPEADGSAVVWREEARVRGMPRRLLDAPTAWAGRLLFGRLVRALLRDP
ncbi:SRPBCC family protein [Streptomyces profundus]|uniref:SRPBCC family protein n=1 Tax=Streptomyces profundus TaxID=2867410 RepID=UPI001D16A26E|nr:SRPBCC family protein [Streptomyces sp. MA3_2.13]UED85130.1 SRPBCC family protein [Streptomyces sp. MA3_2.13]